MLRNGYLHDPGSASRSTVALPTRRGYGRRGRDLGSPCFSAPSGQHGTGLASPGSRVRNMRARWSLRCSRFRPLV